jgi:hypothetical protein
LNSYRYHIQDILPRPFSPENGGRNSRPSFAEFLNINKIKGEYKFTLTVADEFTVSALSMFMNVVFSMSGHSCKNIHIKTTQHYDESAL